MAALEANLLSMIVGLFLQCRRYFIDLYFVYSCSLLCLQSLPHFLIVAATFVFSS